MLSGFGISCPFRVPVLLCVYVNGSDYFLFFEEHVKISRVEVHVYLHKVP